MSSWDADVYLMRGLCGVQLDELNNTKAYLTHCQRMKDAGLTRKEACQFFQVYKSRYDQTLADYNKMYIQVVYPRSMHKQSNNVITTWFNKWYGKLVVEDIAAGRRA